MKDGLGRALDVRVAAVAAAVVVIAALLFTTIDTARTRRQALQTAAAAVERSDDTEVRADRRIDLISADANAQRDELVRVKTERAASDAACSRQIQILEAQVRQLGGRPAVPPS